MKKVMLLAVASLAILGCSSVMAETNEIPKLEIESNIFGSMFSGKEIDFGDTKAVLKLSGEDLDDSKIDSSAATVTLGEGDGYYPSEFSFEGTSLGTEWVNGQLSYTLQPSDLTYVNGGSWTTLGGDGQGLFTFNLNVSGITYDGQPVEDQTFRFQIYNYGRDFKADALNLYGEEPEKIAAVQQPLSESVDAGEEPVWVWVGEDGVNSEKPILCDNFADNFYIVWPAEVNAEDIAENDVVLTLKSAYGDEKILEPEKDYVVFEDNGVTQIAVVYQNLPFIPVYNELEIRVESGETSASKVYDIASVYVYYTMFGGPNGATRGWSFYGFDMDTFTDPQQLLRPMVYTLKLADGEQFYSETEGLVDTEEEASVYDGHDERNVQLEGNHLSVWLLNEPNFPQYVEKEIGGETYTFELIFHTENTGPTAVNTMMYSPEALVTERVNDTWYPIEDYPVPEPAPGYAIPWGTDNWITMEKWAWMNGIDMGWRTINVQDEAGDIVYSNKTPGIEVVKGSSEQFSTPDFEKDSVIWSLEGKDISGTVIDENGLLTVPENETAGSVTVYAQTTDPFSIGAVTVKLVDEE